MEADPYLWCPGNKHLEEHFHPCYHSTICQIQQWLHCHWVVDIHCHHYCPGQFFTPTSGARNTGRDTFYPASRLRLQNSLNTRKRFRGYSIKHSPASKQQMDSTLPPLFHSLENLVAMDKMLWIMLFAFLIRKLESSCSTSHRLTSGKPHPSWAITENQKGS